jgi:hypothetical protein
MIQAAINSIPFLVSSQQLEQEERYSKIDLPVCIFVIKLE